MSQEVTRRAEAAVAALRELTHAALAECGCPPAELSERVFGVQWEPGTTARDLAGAVMRRAAEAVAEGNAYRSGHVYCYACASAVCEHSQPGSAGEVFAGYQSTGRPAWEEFFNYLLAAGDPRTERLFADRPEVLARVWGRRRLTSEQLVSFGRNSLTYRVWGQVTAGYFRVGELRAALTAQLVETADHALHVQLITPTAVVEALAEASPDHRSAFHRVYDALREARQRLTSLSSLWQNAGPPAVRRDLEAQAFGELRHLAHSIERKGRQDQRRTAHAEVRGLQQRPVHKAYDDLAAAAPGDFFRDRFKQSIIVVGRSGRVHAFSDDGRHITSLVIGRDEVERRQQRHRYVPLAAGEVEELRRSAPGAVPDPRPEAAAAPPLAGPPLRPGTR